MNPDNMVEMIATLVVLAIEIALIFLCTRRMRQPVNPAKPRIFPYNAVVIFLGLAVLVTAAHTVSVYTGHKLEAKNKMRGQGQPMR